jgi:hypothetical protein
MGNNLILKVGQVIFIIQIVKKDKYIVVKNYVCGGVVTQVFIAGKIYEGVPGDFDGQPFLFLNIKKNLWHFGETICGYRIPMDHVELLRKNKLRQL